MQVQVQVLVAVKALAHAKTRLSPVLAPARRAALVLAMLADTVDAALRCPAVCSVHVVSPDPRVLGHAAELGAHPVTDPTTNLNDALGHGAAGLDPRVAIAALQGDLPALRPDELGEALACCTGLRAAVPDRDGGGTVLLMAPPGAGLDPRFGPGSAASHRDSGAVVVRGAWPGLRTDVDTADDLAAAVGLGVGARTAAQLPHPPPAAWTPPATSGTIMG